MIDTTLGIENLIDMRVSGHDLCQPRAGELHGRFHIYLVDRTWMCDGCCKPVSFSEHADFMENLAAELDRRTDLHKT